jgi:hypothetical protein
MEESLNRFKWIEFRQMMRLGKKEGPFVKKPVRTNPSYRFPPLPPLRMPPVSAPPTIAPALEPHPHAIYASSKSRRSQNEKL